MSMMVTVDDSMEGIITSAISKHVISVPETRGYPQISVVYNIGCRSGNILWYITRYLRISRAIYHGYLQISRVNSRKLKSVCNSEMPVTMSLFLGKNIFLTEKPIFEVVMSS